MRGRPPPLRPTSLPGAPPQRRRRCAPTEQLDDAARDIRVVERERPLDAGADDEDVLAGSRAASTTAERLRSEAMSTRSQRAAADTTARVPFVVESISVSPAASRYSRGEFPRSNPGMRTPDARLRGFPRRERLEAHEHPRPRPHRTPVDSRMRAPGRSSRWPGCRVDHDPGRGGTGLVRSEDDVDSHVGTLAAVDEPLRCYRHPDRETYVSCSECGRGVTARTA